MQRFDLLGATLYFSHDITSNPLFSNLITPSKQRRSSVQRIMDSDDKLPSAENQWLQMDSGFDVWRLIKS